jgi:predicted nucleotidyltransferase
MTARPGCFEEIERAFRRVAEALGEARVEFMLGGSLASWVRGGPESCNDLDLMIRPEDSDRALEALADAGMRTERPTEGWLVKAWDGDVLVDLICRPMGVPIDDEVFARAEEVSAWGVPVTAMGLEDVLVSKLLALQEHALDYARPLELARALRERIDWPQVRARTSSSPYARAFFALLEEIGILGGVAEAAEQRPRIRVATTGGR